MDALFFVDSAVSLIFGAISLLTPHGILQKFIGGSELVCVAVACSAICVIHIALSLIIFFTISDCSLNLAYNHDAHEVLR